MTYQFNKWYYYSSSAQDCVSREKNVAHSLQHQVWK